MDLHIPALTMLYHAFYQSCGPKWDWNQYITIFLLFGKLLLKKSNCCHLAVVFCMFVCVVLRLLSRCCSLSFLSLPAVWDSLTGTWALQTHPGWLASVTLEILFLQSLCWDCRCVLLHEFYECWDWCGTFYWTTSPVPSCSTVIISYQKLRQFSEF